MTNQEIHQELGIIANQFDRLYVDLDIRSAKILKQYDRIEKKLDALLRVEQAKEKVKQNDFDTGRCNYIGGNTVCKLIQDALGDDNPPTPESP